MRIIWAMLVCVLLAGCASIPEGYDWDTTPDHDGEEYVGGAP